MDKTTQKWLWDKSLNVLEWPSQSLDLNPIEHLLKRPENGCAAMLPIQPDRTLDDLQIRMGETPQIQVRQTCSVIPKKTYGHNRCQRCFNKVLSKGSEYICKCDISRFFYIFIFYINLLFIFKKTVSALSLWCIVCKLMRGREKKRLNQF
jgi:hypothetical protein